MAEEMDAMRENENRSNDTSTTETAQPTNANAEKQQTNTPKAGGLRGKVGKETGGKEKAAGQNVATNADSSKTQTTAPTETKTDSKPKEKEALTKETTEEKAPATDNKQAEETEAKSEEENAKEPTTVAPINTATPQSVTWKELRTMLNEKTFLSLTYKVQLSPTFFNTVCPSTLQGKEDIVKQLQELKANDTTFGSDKTFVGKQAALQQMMTNASTIAQNLQAMLGGEMNAIQRVALQAYTASVNNYVQSLQRKINNNQVVWNYFFGNSGFKLEEALATDKDFTAKLLEFSKKEASSENIEAYLAIDKGMTPKKFMFGTLFTGLKDDAATVDKLLKDPQLRSKNMALNLPNPILVEMLQAYKDQKMGTIKKGMKKQVARELLTNISDTFARFSQSNPTGDQV